MPGKPGTPNMLHASVDETAEGKRKAARAEVADLMHKVASSQDRAAFQQLFDTFAPVVKGMMMRQGANADTAEDLAQEAMMSVWRKAALYQSDKGSVATWVFTIARNLRIDRLRREVPWQELTDERAQVESDAPRPDDEVASAQIQRRMRRVLATLPGDQQQVVELAYLDGLSHSEIAEKLKLPLGTVKSRMRLAYQKIKDAFEGQV